MTSQIHLFSVDDHIIEHPTVWSDRVPKKFLETAPHVVDEGGEQFWRFEDVRHRTIGLNAVAGKDNKDFSPDPVRYDDMILGCYDPVQRAKDFLADGILASLLFPTLPRFGGALFPTFKDKELAKVCVEAYNDFILDEWCPAGPPGMFVPAIIVMLWDPVASAAEIRRCADKGASAVLMPENTVTLGLESFFSDHWNPIWQACQDHDLPICMHIGAGGWMPNPSPDGPPPLSWSLQQVGSIMSAVNLMWSPVCRLYPGLKFVFSEGGIGWAPNALERADRLWLRHQYHAKLDGMLPSEIFQRNMYLCMIEEPVCLKYRYDIGVDKIMWECDYPHADTVWPHSQKSAHETFAAANVPDDEIQAIAHGNAERVFNWKMADPSLIGATSW